MDWIHVLVLLMLVDIVSEYGVEHLSSAAFDLVNAR